MTLLITYLLIALVTSFLCSILESVLMSTPLSYITMREEEGSKAAKRFKNYKLETDRPLAAILSLNTIANTIGAAGVGKQAAIVLDSIPFGFVSATVTLLILIFSEIIPKTIGTSYWKHLMNFTARTIAILIVVMHPFVIMIQLITQWITPKETEASVSREEVSAMANVGEEEGVIEENENKIIQNIIKLENIKAFDVMTPRVVAAIAPESMTLREFYDNDDYLHFSRIPVYADSKEFITGYVLRSDALEELAEDHFDLTLGSLKRDISYFNEEQSISSVWEDLLKNKGQIAVMIDEYGCFQGILTLEDIIETILGLEIIDENDEVSDLQQFARERWEKRQKQNKNFRVLPPKTQESKTDYKEDFL
ncbi:MAG: DUF21 domain-containing protein [Bacteroidales bacterium]|nr:DUF21 domain-containing protein [Bacteroidales bacterium]MBP5722396.1 DUF21 domain-containing protein [Bacteroidales bacterium]MBQ3676727.1 DUF21 domain-containing protein [Bacteroidales bacterium]MBQ4214777.1 DUF21 domain-containing protein [Bacteroidales bacterium]MBR4498488.1 DUF21 domain-containing protein [Bacteroidales bacterium]